MDGSYLIRKHEQLHQAGVNVAPLGPPSLPLSGWITINETNYKDESLKIPTVLPGMLKSLSPSIPLSLPPSVSLSLSLSVPHNHVTASLILQGSSMRTWQRELDVQRQLKGLLEHF